MIFKSTIPQCLDAVFSKRPSQGSLVTETGLNVATVRAWLHGGMFHEVRAPIAVAWLKYLNAHGSNLGMSFQWGDIVELVEGE